MRSTPLGGLIGFFFEIFFSNFRSHIKDSKWGRKCIFMNCASRNGSPQQIPLRQLPFANEAENPIPIAEDSGLCSYFYQHFHGNILWKLNVE